MCVEMAIKLIYKEISEGTATAMGNREREWKRWNHQPTLRPLTYIYIHRVTPNLLNVPKEVTLQQVKRKPLEKNSQDFFCHSHLFNE